MKWFFLMALGVACGCTIVAVTKGASADNAALTAHTDDAGFGAADVRLVHIPAMDHSPGSKRAVYNFNGGYPRLVANERGPGYKPKDGQNLSKPLGYIPQVTHTYAYFDQDYGMMNERQLSIAESTCGAKTVGWASDVPYGYNLFGIAELSKLALERCDSARCAIRTMGDAAVKYGFYSEDSGSPLAPGYADSGEALAIADKYGETWIFHVLTGPQNSSAVWAAQRVPDGHITAIANSFRIRQMNLSDPENFLASSNVKSFAHEMQWWNANLEFDFTAAYGFAYPGPLMPLYAGRRIWRVLDWFAPSLQFDSTMGSITDVPTYPFSVKPDTLVTLTSVMDLLKDHYEGTPYDMTQGLAAGPFGAPIRYDGPHAIPGGWERPISMYRTMFSFILQTRGKTNKVWLDDYVGGTIWYGQGSPHGSVYVPFSCAQKRLPQTYGIGKESEFNHDSMWSIFNFVNNWSMLRWNAINADVRTEALKWQQEAISQQQKWLESEAAPDLDDMERENNAFADRLFRGWWALAWKLVAKYSDGYITTGEEASEMQMLGYPTWWLNATDFRTWPHETWHPPVINVPRTIASGASGLEIAFYVSLGLVTGISIMWSASTFSRRFKYSLLLCM